MENDKKSMAIFAAKQILAIFDPKQHKEEHRHIVAYAYLEAIDEIAQLREANAKLIKSLRRAANGLIIAGQPMAGTAARLDADRYAAKGL